MTILSRRNFNNIEILNVDSLTSVTALPGSLAKLSSSNSVYKTLDGSTWSLLRSQSSSGPQGAQGNPGSQGPQGASGNVGAQGYQGSPGDAGDQGDPGAQGSQGNVGHQGQQGNPGPQGAQGSTNESGDKGPQGLQGPQGVQGSQGSQGNQGAQGSQGLQGSQGVQGTQGDAGSLTSGGGIYLVQSQTVTGSFVSSVTFSGLDGNAHKNYLLFSRIFIGGSAATPYYVQLELNGSSSDANIREISRFTTAASTFSTRTNKHLMINNGSSGSYYITKTDMKTSSSYPRYIKDIGGGYFAAASSNAVFENAARWDNTADNLTSFNISSYLSSSNASASVIASGSSFHLYRYEV